MKKAGISPITKPFCKGTVIDDRTFKRSLKVMLMTVVFGIVFLLIGQVFVGLGIIGKTLNVLSLIAVAIYYYNDGLGAGVDDVAFGEIVFAQEERGSSIDRRNRAYHPGKGWMAVFFGLIPLLLLTDIFALPTQKQTYTLGVLPDWLEGYVYDTVIRLALSYYHQVPKAHFSDALRVPVRILLMPYLPFFNINDPSQMLILERLSPLVISVITTVYSFGYMQGPKVRAKVHAGIKEGVLKKKRKAREESERR